MEVNNKSKSILLRPWKNSMTSKIILAHHLNLPTLHSCKHSRSKTEKPPLVVRSCKGQSWVPKPKDLSRPIVNQAQVEMQLLTSNLRLKAETLALNRRTQGMRMSSTVKVKSNQRGLCPGYLPLHQGFLVEPLINNQGNVLSNSLKQNTKNKQTQA